MSADILRRAAALMRERAETATDGPWSSQTSMVVADPGPNALYVADCFDAPESPADAAHIASWHPAVALAVADWLDATAQENDSPADGPLGFLNFVGADAIAAITVARAYLGESA